VSGEPMRPSFHFTPVRNWMNDPNGLVWYDGEYHLFFQYNPLGSDWGNMSWGHAVSSDLVSWEELPVALEHTASEAVFSGSVVVDRANTSGLGTEETPAMVAVYTSVDLVTGHQGQSVASSVDRGRTWTRHPKNPVLEIGSTDFRDPKVWWYASGGCWVMAVVLAVERVVRLYRSDDLLTWTHLSDFGPAGSTDGIWECPDLFPLAVDGDPARTRWVLVVSVQEGAPAGGSGMQYFVGDFDGTTFTADSQHGSDAQWIDHGADYYAAVSFNDEPHDRRLLIGWMNNWQYAREVPARPYRGAMSALRRYELRTHRGGAVLVQRPVIEDLPAPAHRISSQDVPEGVHPLSDGWRDSCAVLTAELDPGSATRAGLLVRVGSTECTVVGYDATERALYVDRTASGDSGFHPGFGAVHSAPLDLDPGETLALEIHVDATSVEVYADGGRVVITDQVFPSPASDGISLFAEGGTAHLRSLTSTPVGRDG
jgi:fructan beta-fructosidase